MWKLLEPYEAMTVAHHVGGGPIATNWDIIPGPKEWLVEISSVHGSSECYGCNACIYNPVKGAFVRFAAEDPSPPAGTSWYYARVQQKNGGMAWSSPVWVTVE